jgi:hypothetical protein
MRSKFDEERSQLRALLGQAEEDHVRAIHQPRLALFQLL